MKNKKIFLSLCLSGSLLASFTLYAGVNDGVALPSPPQQGAPQTYQYTAPTPTVNTQSMPYSQTPQAVAPQAINGTSMPIQSQPQNPVPTGSYGSINKPQAYPTSYNGAVQGMPGVQTNAQSAVSAPASQLTAPISYPAKYVYGNAPFDVKTKVLFTQTNDGFVVSFASKTGQQSWQLPIKSIRGAELGDKGLWFYWFDAYNNTLNAFFEMPQGAPQLAATINAAVGKSNETNLEQYKQRFEQYQSEALKNAE